MSLCHCNINTDFYTSPSVFQFFPSLLCCPFRSLLLAGLDQLALILQNAMLAVTHCPSLCRLQGLASHSSHCSPALAVARAGLTQGRMEVEAHCVLSVPASLLCPSSA